MSIFKHFAFPEWNFVGFMQAADKISPLLSCLYQQNTQHFPLSGKKFVTQDISL